jgi:hypothetical protein
MSEFRDLVLEAHGGTARWKQLTTIEADMSITGLLWARKGWPDVLKDVCVTADIGSQHASYRPFTAKELRSVYRPDQVAIEASDGRSIKSRVDPRSAFDGHTLETAWDDLHLAYFSGYAIWNYLNTPFLFTLPGFAIEEIEPWSEHGEKRRRLKVSFPATVATHGPEQIFHVNGDGLICRLDYSAKVAGGLPTAHYVDDYRDFDGIKLWTKRRAYRRNADGTANVDAVAVAIDVVRVRLS